MTVRGRRKRVHKSLHAGSGSTPPNLLDEEDLRKIRLFRTHVVYGVMAIACTGLILRLSYLQITRAPDFRSQAMNTAIATIPILPARGRLYDTNGNLLAYDAPHYSLYYTQIAGVNTSDEAIARISGVMAKSFGTAAADIVRWIHANQSYRTVRLFTQLTDWQLAFIGEHQASLPGISVQVEGVRHYPYGDLAGQVLGYVGAITARQQHQYLDLQHYQFNQTIGQAGLEREYERYLQGRIGYQLQPGHAHGGVTNQASYNPAPLAGNNLQLTLDGRLQADTQNFVQAAIQKFERRGKVQITDGAAVVIDVNTGGVLAMVSYPYMDPNWFITGAFLQHQQYLTTSGAEQNNVIANPHYPGSTVKPANLLVGLEHGVVTPNTVFSDAATPLWVGNYPLREDASYGTVDNVRAIAVSDDKFFYTLGLNLGRWLGSSASNGGAPLGGFAHLQSWKDTWFVRGILAMDAGEMRFGLGQLTGIDLPWEQQGTFYISDSRYNPAPAVDLDVRHAQQVVRQTGRFRNYGSPLDLAFTAFGQMQQFTPMELAQYVGTLAHDGVRLQPHLLDKVLPPGMHRDLRGLREPAIYQQSPRVQAQLRIDSKFLRIVQQGMYAACNTPGGTAYPVFGNAAYAAAGKTGTAEIVMNGQPVSNSVFIGYAPFHHPRIAVAVMVPGAGFGATTAVPIAKAIMDDYFKEHHVPFLPKSAWESTDIPSTWKQSPAYLLPEHTH